MALSSGSLNQSSLFSCNSSRKFNHLCTHQYTYYVVNAITLYEFVCLMKWIKLLTTFLDFIIASYENFYGKSFKIINYIWCEVNMKK